MNLIEITDINAPQMDVFARVTERELRTCEDPKEGMFIAESAYVIRLALENGYEPLEMLVEKERLEIEAAPVLEAIEKYCGKDKAESIPVYVADRRILQGQEAHRCVDGCR